MTSKPSPSSARATSLASFLGLRSGVVCSYAALPMTSATRSAAPAMPVSTDSSTAAVETMKIRMSAGVIAPLPARIAPMPAVWRRLPPVAPAARSRHHPDRAPRRSAHLGVGMTARRSHSIARGRSPRPHSERPSGAPERPRAAPAEGLSALGHDFDASLRQGPALPGKIPGGRVQILDEFTGLPRFVTMSGPVSLFSFLHSPHLHLRTCPRTLSCAQAASDAWI